MKADALPSSGWLARLLAPVLCGPWGQGCVDLACTGVLGSGGDTQMPRGHCRRLPGGRCPAWVSGEGSKWGLGDQPEAQSAWTPLRSAPEPPLPVGLWGQHWGSTPEGPGEYGVLTSQEPLEWPGGDPASALPAPSSISLPASSGSGLPLPWARGPYCLNFLKSPALGSANQTGWYLSLQHCDLRPGEPGMLPARAGGAESDQVPCAGPLRGQAFRPSSSIRPHHGQSLGFSSCEMAKGTLEGDGLNPQSIRPCSCSA